MSKWNARPTQQLSRIEVEPSFTLENVPTPTLIIDEFGRVLHFNRRASVLLESATGRRCSGCASSNCSDAICWSHQIKRRQPRLH